MTREHHQNTLKDEQMAMYRAYARWFMDYTRAPLADSNLLEAWKAAWHARGEYERLAITPWRPPKGDA